MLDEFLVEHARDNVWCQPFQDKQSILKLSRISPNLGVTEVIGVSWDPIKLPTAKDVYHVYQIGANNWDRLSWPMIKDRWVQFKYWGERNSQVINLHTNQGVSLPLSTAYFYRTNEDNYLVAIRYEPKRWDIEKDEPYLRCYRNAFWDSLRSNETYYKVLYGGGIVIDKNGANNIIQEIALLQGEAGAVLIYHNGNLVHSVNLRDVKVGDYLEYTYDGSVKRIVDFKVANLPDFESKLDAIKKYLLHPIKDKDETTIRYRDDVDVYLYALKGNNFKGRYYHRYDEKSLRMVTHFDYSIPVPHVLAYLKNPDDQWAQYEELHIRLYIRESGYARPLVHETNRIQELYRLTDTEILDAMVGDNAVFERWTVAHLESSLYTWIMRQWWMSNIKAEHVRDAYGYNAITKLIADIPLMTVVDPNGNYVDLPVGLRNGATIYEYDDEGLLLGFYPYPAGVRYYTRNPKTHMVEGVVGLAQRDAKWIQGNEPVRLDGDFNYHLYVCKKVKDKPTYEYKEALLDVNYTLLDGELTWIHDRNGWEGLVLSDETFTGFSVTDNQVSGVYKFTITRTDGTPITVKPEQLDVWCNGRYLAEGFDYILNWPVGYVVNKDVIVKGDNLFTFRAVGFADVNGESKPITDSGFVEYGLLSYDGHYHTRNDKVVSVFLNGRLKNPSDCSFSEDWLDNRPGPHHNGDVYSIKQMPVPVRGVDLVEYRNMRDDARKVDSDLEAYLTVRYPEVKFDTPSPIDGYHYLFSPLMVTLTRDLLSGVLIAPYEPDNVHEVNRAMVPYMHFLPYEPARNPINPNYVKLIPHPEDDYITMGERSLRFLESVNRFYLESKLELNNFYRIEGVI